MKKENIVNAINNALAKITGKPVNNGAELPGIRPSNVEADGSWFSDGKKLKRKWDNALIDIEGETKSEIYKEERDLAISKAKKRKEVLKEEYELEQGLWLEFQKADLLIKSEHAGQILLSEWVEQIINDKRLTDDQQEHLLERAVVIIGKMNGTNPKKGEV